MEKNEKLQYLLNLNDLTAYKVAQKLGYFDVSNVIGRKYAVVKIV